MRRWARAAAAVVRRDALVEASYPLSAAFSIAAGLFGLWILFFLGKTVGQAHALAAHGGDYFRFAVVGTAFMTVARGGLTGVSRRVREAQIDGTLVHLLGTPAPAPLVLAAMTAYPIASAAGRAGIYLAGAVALFGADYAFASPCAAFVAAGAGVVASLGIGMIAAAVVMLLRRGDHLSWAIETLSMLMSGVFYPIEALPPGFQTAAQALPATHAIAAVRASLVSGASLSDIAPRLFALALITAATLPMGVLATRFALARLERDGSAGHA